MKQYIYPLFLLLYIVSSSSCHTDSIEFIPYDQTDYISTFFENSSTKAEQFIIDASKDQNLYIPKTNTVVFIPASSITYTDNKAPEDNITILIEIADTYKDLILNQWPCQSNNNLIDIFKLISINATDNTGKELKISNLSQIVITQAITNVNVFAPNLKLLTLENDQWANYYSSNGEVNLQNVEYDWSPYGLNQNISSIQYNIDKLGVYTIASPRVINDKNSKKVQLEMPARYTSNNSYAFVIFEEGTSILPLDYNTTTRIFSNTNYKIPNNTSIRYIVISKINENNYHFGTANAIITSNHMESIEPLSTEISDILEYLGSL